MPFFSPRLEINMRQVQENFKNLAALAAPAQTSAVVKANAYGLGVNKIAPALLEAGCEIFWVARTHEAIELRAIAPTATIYVLGGPEDDSLETYRSLKLRPVISTPKQLASWIAFADGKNIEPIALHVETGLHRLAITDAALSKAIEAWRTKKIEFALIISHLACADSPQHPLNQSQLARFETIKKLFPGIPCSLSASYGLFLSDSGFKQDLVRMGRALYGIKAPNESRFLTKPVLKMSAPVVQIADVPEGATVGYSATYATTEKRRIATLAIGYADGLPRALQAKGHVFFMHGSKTYAAPITGRISMDLMSCDATGIPPEAVSEGSMGYFIMDEHDVETFAAEAGMLCYEFLTRLGARFERLYAKD